jgi:hypothetical protein
MSRRQHGRPGKTEPPQHADHGDPTAADLLRIWIAGRHPRPQESHAESQPVAEVASVPTAEDALERTHGDPWDDVLPGETTPPPHRPPERTNPLVEHDERASG